MSDDLEGIRKGAQLAGMVAMAIPPPEGPIIMAALQIFAALLPTPPKPDVSKEILDAIHELPELIGNNAALAKAHDLLAAIYDGIDTQQKDWASAKGKSNEDTQIDTCRDNFSGLWQIGGTPATTLQGLLAVDTTGVSGFLAGRAAVSAYVNLVLGLVIAQKVYVELSAGKVAVLSRRRQAGERGLEKELRLARSQLRTDFNDLRVAVQVYNDATSSDYVALQALIAALAKARPGLATVKTTGVNSEFHGPPESHFIDDPLANPTQQNLVTDTSTQEVIPGYVTTTRTTFQCRKGEVDAALPGYQKGVSDQLAADMADALSVLSKLKAQIDEIGDIAPDDPAEGPECDWIDPGVAGYWTRPGEAVCWGIQFQRGRQSSRIVWSDWQVAPKHGKIPKLSLPVDGTGLGQTRVVYRLLAKKKGKTPPKMSDPPDDAETVLLVPDNVTDWACDSEMDTHLGLPPLPQGPPIAPSAPDAGSDPDARRYCYTYRGGTLESPLGASPESGWLKLAPGDALYVPNVGDWTPVVYARGKGSATAPAGGTATADGDGQMWTWKAP